MSLPQRTKQQVLYDAIRERILMGTYTPGFRVVIDSLATEFGVSAVPVREAIRRLEAEGLLAYRPNVGAQVTPADPGMFEHEMEVLAVLEGYATALAAPSLDGADLERLTAHTDLMVSAMEQMDPLAFGRCNRAFHVVIYERCPNASLVDLLRQVEGRLDAIRRTVFVYIPYRGAESIAEHRSLIELLSGGASPAVVERAARSHKLATLESFKRWQGQQTGGADGR